MKNHFIFAIAIFSGAAAYSQVTGITPATAYQGQSIHTTITSSGSFMSSSSPQGNILDIILANATDSIFANSDSTNVVDANTATAFFNIPANIAAGIYNLMMRIVTIGIPITSTLNNAFTVTTAASTISGTVYDDLNRNGVKDAGEPGIPGYTVQLSSNGNSAVTDSAGNYTLGTLPGLDTVKLVQAANDIYSSTSPTSVILNVLNGANTGYNYGLVLSRFLISISPALDTAGQTVTAIITDSAVTRNATLVSVVLENNLGYNIYSNASIIDSAHISTQFNAPQNYPGGKWDIVVTVADNSTNLTRSYRLDTAVKVVGPIGVVTGYVYIDSNNNGIKDPNEPGISAQYINLSGPYNYSATSDSTGYYKFYGVLNGNYTVLISNPNSYYSSCAAGSAVYTPGSYLVTVNSDTTANKDFADMAANSSSYDLFIHPGWRPANPGFVRHYWIYYGNQSNVPVTGGVITFQYDSTLVFDSCDRTPSTNDLTTHTLTWNVGTINPTAFIGWYGGGNDFNLYMSVPASDSSGRLLYSSFTITPTTNDCSTWNNIVNDITPVTSSRDPNEKHANPYSRLLYNQDSIVEYTINFQNTGTASTHFVIVRDTLDSSLDPKSVIITGSSSSYTFDNNNGALTFTLNPLVLTDSADDEKNSHGFVSFMAKLKPGLAVNTVIKNQASIYFDYNNAVLTNTAVNTIQNPLAVKNINSGSGVSVRPNPFTENTVISFENKGSDKYGVTLYDIDGNLVGTYETSDSQLSIERKGLQAGVYIFKLTNQRTKVSAQGKIVAGP